MFGFVCEAASVSVVHSFLYVTVLLIVRFVYPGLQPGGGVVVVASDGDSQPMGGRVSSFRLLSLLLPLFLGAAAGSRAEEARSTVEEMLETQWPRRLRRRRLQELRPISSKSCISTGASRRQPREAGASADTGHALAAGPVRGVLAGPGQGGRPAHLRPGQVMLSRETGKTKKEGRQTPEFTSIELFSA